jgi:hypothetical protein
MTRSERPKHGQYYPRGRGVEDYERHCWVQNPCRNHSRPLAEIRRKGLISALRDRARRR